MIPAARHRLFNINGWMHSRNSRRSEVQGTDRSSSIDSGEKGRPVKPVSIILNEYSFSQTGPLSQLLLSHSIRLLLPWSVLTPSQASSSSSRSFAIPGADNSLPRSVTPATPTAHCCHSARLHGLTALCRFPASGGRHLQQGRRRIHHTLRQSTHAGFPPGAHLRRRSPRPSRRRSILQNKQCMARSGGITRERLVIL